MFDHARSAARGEMAARKPIVFKHASKLGNAPAHKLFETVTVKPSNGADTPPRSYGDYTVTIDRAPIPPGVNVSELI